VPDLYAALVRVEPGAVEFQPRADAKDRIPAADVLVLRTRSGGWAKVAVVERTRAGGWTEYPATFRFAWNPREPVFEEGRIAREDHGGFGLDWLDPGVVESRERSRRFPGGGIESGPARALLARLEEERLSVNATGTTLKEVADLLGGMGVPVDLAPGVDPARGLDLHLRKVTLVDALKAVTFSVDCNWTISEDGRVVIIPGRKGK